MRVLNNEYSFLLVPADGSMVIYRNGQEIGNPSVACADPRTMAAATLRAYRRAIEVHEYNHEGRTL